MTLKKEVKASFELVGRLFLIVSGTQEKSGDADENRSRPFVSVGSLNCKYVCIRREPRRPNPEVIYVLCWALHSFLFSVLGAGYPLLPKKRRKFLHESTISFGDHTPLEPPRVATNCTALHLIFFQQNSRIARKKRTLFIEQCGHVLFDGRFGKRMIFSSFSLLFQISRRSCRLVCQ